MLFNGFLFFFDVQQTQALSKIIFPYNAHAIYHCTPNLMHSSALPQTTLTHHLLHQIHPYLGNTAGTVGAPHKVVVSTSPQSTSCILAFLGHLGSMNKALLSSKRTKAKRTRERRDRASAPAPLRFGGFARI